jgi:hypothetical protein
MIGPRTRMDCLEKEKSFDYLGETNHVRPHRKFGNTDKEIRPVLNKICDSFSVSSVSTKVRKIKQYVTFKSVRYNF